MDKVIQFLSTPSARRATVVGVVLALVDGISIHALREEGDLTANCILAEDVISIHALREEGDRVAVRRGDMSQISIHALREEGDKSSKEA